MKKLIVGIAAAALALSSTAAMADTPAVKELNNFDHIVEVAHKNSESTRSSEFVIYHQGGHHPCATKGKHGKDGHHHHHHHDGEKKAEGHHHHHHAKKAKKPADDQKKPAGDNSSAQ